MLWAGWTFGGGTRVFSGCNLDGVAFVIFCAVEDVWLLLIPISLVGEAMTTASGTCSNPLVSVVIPTRNRCALLRRCLNALAAQTYRPFEVIVVDDGSTDCTPEVLACFRGESGRYSVTTLRNDPQAGANPSRNRAIRVSRGSFVAFLDDDCIAADNWLERLLAGFVSQRVAAVTGRIDDPPPENVFELAFKGTHRVDGRVHAVRLVAGNMCVRRDLLLRCMLDEDRATADSDVAVSGRGDEEGLFLALKAGGYDVRVAEDAIVTHEHHYTASSFFRQAYRGGKATARLGYKFGLPPRIELMPLLLAYLFVPLAGKGWWWLASVVPAAVFLAAVLYNEVFRKRKTPIEVFLSFLFVVAFFHFRLVGYVVQYLRLWTGRDRIARVNPSEVGVDLHSSSE